MNQQLTNYAEEFVNIFRSLHKSFRSHIIKEACNYGFTVPQVLLMHELYHNPGITLNELSKKLSLSKSTVSGIIDRLEKSEYIVKETPEENRRIVKISLSEKALKHQEWINNIKTQHLSELFNKLGLEETEKIINAFRKLNDVVTIYDENN
ncbi:MarR family winged helix-turn-helix transcriptional regulator [Clostridium sp. OS1-26]|uniref:MarR family winged helix-turn-helix transcriptional regulator n=1 Tax=Clostridium sp. OS1-26 TaxID=3070681 RepID=UPI0027DF84C0|nr:MarR family winged helix-turn-helix transcriptional regulator [Clostridium sp. OS1-26]WML37253.1 MarR family winged helix-turn-helix transcriptional regulator [Clostridium sp. OS1-26]